MASGNLYFPNDSHKIERSDGTNWDEWGPIYPLGRVPAFAWRNQGTATLDSTKGGEYLTIPSSAGYNLRIREVAWPTPPFRITVMLRWTWDINDFNYTGISFNDGTKVKGFGYWSNGAAGVLRADNWTNVTTYSGVIGANTVTLNAPFRTGTTGPLFISLYDDNAGTPKWHYSYSSDGYYWQDLVSENRNTFLTPTKIGWMGFELNGGAFTSYCSILSWKQTAS